MRENYGSEAKPMKEKRSTMILREIMEALDDYESLINRTETLSNELERHPQDDRIAERPETEAGLMGSLRLVRDRIRFCNDRMRSEIVKFEEII